MSEFNGGVSRGSREGGVRTVKRAGIAATILVVLILIAVFAWRGLGDKEASSAGLASRGQSGLTAPLTDGKPAGKPSPAHFDQPDQQAPSSPNLEAFTPPSMPMQAASQPTGPQAGQAQTGTQQNAFNPNGLPAVPGPAAAAGPQMSAKVYHAKHKEGLGGGPWGQLTLSANGIQFVSENEHYNFSLDSIASQNADGFVLKSGEKYHFRMDGLSKDQVAAEFSNWFQQIVQLKVGQALTRAPRQAN